MSNQTPIGRDGKAQVGQRKPHIFKYAGLWRVSMWIGKRESIPLYEAANKFVSRLNEPLLDIRFRRHCAYEPRTASQSR